MNKQVRVAVIMLATIHVLFTPIPGLADSPGTSVSCEEKHFSFGQHMVLASSGQALFRLSDTGWTRVPVPGIWEQVRVAGDNTIYLYSNETHDVFRSRNGGLNWSMVTTLNLSDYAIQDFYVALDDHSLFLSGNSTFSGQPSIWRSLDDGATWQRTLDLSGYSLSILSPLAFSPAFSQDGTVFSAQLGRGTFVGIWKSSDFGLSWSKWFIH